MLRNSNRAEMSASVRASTKVTPPVMICKLCHCEFTNFKEHVKSLVHLDARETTLISKPPCKQKSSNSDSGECAKKPKMDVEDEKSSASRNIKVEDMSSETKESASSIGKADAPVPVEKDASPSSSFEEEEDPKGEAYDTDLNGTDTTKTDKKDVSDIKTEEQIEIKNYAKAIGEDLTEGENIFLNKHWQCELCGHVHRLEDGSFDKHAHDEGHKKSLELQLNSLRESYSLRKSCQWLLNCLACSFHTNDKAQYISHLQTDLHDQNIKAAIGNSKVAFSGDKPLNHKERREETEEKKKTAQPLTSNVPQKDTNNKQVAKASPVQADRTKQNNSSSKPITPQTQANKSTPKNSPNITPLKGYQQKTQGGSSIPRNGKQHNTSKSNPKPLMSLSLPERLNKDKSGWKPASALMRNQSPSNKPGILGEYRPEFSHKNFRFDGLNRDESFGRSAERLDSLSHFGIGSSSLSVGRPTYPDVNRNALSATQTRTNELDPYRGTFGPGRYDSVWSAQSSLSAPTEKLNSIAFGRVEPESPSRRFEVLANLLSRQRTAGNLPSTVSLDLATNSSIRYKYGSDRGALFDSYPASRPDLSRTDFTRNNLPGTDLSRPDPFARSMYSRR